MMGVPSWMLWRDYHTAHCRTQEDFFIFLLCLEKTAFSTDDDEVLKTCSSHANLSEKSLRQCMEGKLGEPQALPMTPVHRLSCLSGSQ